MTDPAAPAPRDNIVWVRCDDTSRGPALAELAARLNAEGDPVKFLITLRQPTEKFIAHPKGTQGNREFVAQYQPLIALSIGGTFDPAMLSACHAASVPVVSVDTRPDALREMTGGWFRARAKPVLSMLHAAFVSDLRLRDGLVKMGAPQSRVFVAGPMDEGTLFLSFNEGERAAIAETLRNRPVWLARGIDMDELDLLLAAHRHATRRSHRLLLVVIPRGHDAKLMQEKARQQGFATALRSEMSEPDEQLQVFFADLEDEAGLWLRLAPVTYAGGSFVGGAHHDPFEAASLGAVTLHGMELGRWEDRFRRLLRAGASHGVSDPGQLGQAIGALLTPERTAEMASAGWDVTSSGAEISNQIIEIIQNRIDGAAG